MISLNRDIIDEEYCDGNFFKMLLGSINPLFDDDDEDEDTEHAVFLSQESNES
jgi:hypothetical protein